MQIRKITALLLSLLLCLAAFCGCGEEEAAAVTLRTMSTLGDADEYAVYSSLISGFSAAYPDVYIRDTTVAAAEAFRLNYDKAETYSRAGAPHVVYCNAADCAALLPEYFVSLDEIREVYPDFAADLDAAALECFRQPDGSIYCLPVMGEWSAIVVNTALFDQFSVTIPSDWSSLLYAVSELSSRGVLPFANAADDAAIILESLLFSYGGEDTASLGLQGYSNIISSDWQLALSDFAQLVRSGAFAPAALSDAMRQQLIDSAPPVSPTDVSATDAPAASAELFCGHPAAYFPPLYDDVLGADRDRSTRTDACELFCSGKAAMIALDSSQLSDIRFDETCAVIPIPAPDGSAYDNTIPGGFTCGFAITRRAFSDPALRDAAVAFAETMISREAAAQYAALGYLPAVTGSGFDGAAAELLSGGADHRFCLSSRTGSAMARWSFIEQLCSQLYYGLLTPGDICQSLSDPALIWTGGEVSSTDAA